MVGALMCLTSTVAQLLPHPVVDETSTLPVHVEKVPKTQLQQTKTWNEATKNEQTCNEERESRHIRLELLSLHSISQL